jgi:hypothetical protein
LSDKPGGTPSTEGEAVFGFEDLQGLREEYEERIRILKQEHEAQLKKDGASRQELITDLTYELAAAREEGEMRARGAEAKRMSLESELRTALEAIDRIEAEVQRVKLALADALSPTDTNVAANAAPAAVSGVSATATMPSPSQPAPPPSSGPVPTTARPAEMTTTAMHMHSGPVPVAARPEVSGPITTPMGVPMPSFVPAEVPVQASDVVATAPATATPPPVPADPTPASTAAGARRKKIRLR